MSILENLRRSYKAEKLYLEDISFIYHELRNIFYKYDGEFYLFGSRSFAHDKYIRKYLIECENTDIDIAVDTSFITDYTIGDLAYEIINFQSKSHDYYMANADPYHTKKIFKTSIQGYKVDIVPKDPYDKFVNMWDNITAEEYKKHIWKETYRNLYNINDPSGRKKMVKSIHNFLKSKNDEITKIPY